MPFFPTPYPDELLYSLVARYHVWSRNSFFRYTSEDLFDSNTISSKVALPNRLNILVDKLPSNSLITLDRLINLHTLFPFFRLFLPLDRCKRILNAMKSEQINASMFAGIQQSQMSTISKFFRYCSKCAIADEKKYGETYWHRTHQIFGVKVCPIHSVKLIESSITITERNYKTYRLMNIDITEHCEFEKNNHYIHVAQDVFQLLNENIPMISFDELSNRYIYYLKKKGLATFNGSIKETKLVKEFIQYFGWQFLKEMKSEVADGDNWLIALFRNKKTVHPLRHVLFIRFLGQTPLEFFKNDIEEDEPFGKGPWICFNAASNHYLEPVINKCELKSGTNSSDNLIGTFSCECGYSYSRKNQGTNELDLYKIGHIKHFGHVWEKELIQLRTIEKKTIKEIAKKLKVTPLTVIRKLKKLELSEENNEILIQSKFDEKLKFYRSNWRKSIKENPDKKKTELRKIAKKDYIWLYRHDREWLENNSPIPSKRTVNYNETKWKTRDDEYSQMVLKVVRELKQLDCRPIKLTKYSIGKNAGIYRVLKYSPERLPKTISLLNSFVETDEEVNIRRIQWATKKLTSEGESITFVKIRKKAGIQTKSLNEKLEMMIQSQIEELYDDSFYS